MRQVIIFDQFGMSPYVLHESKMTFQYLLNDVREHPRDYQGSTAPQITLVEEDFCAPWATTIIAEDENGMPFVWKSNWDSSG